MWTRISISRLRVIESSRSEIFLHFKVTSNRVLEFSDFHKSTISRTCPISPQVSCPNNVSQTQRFAYPWPGKLRKPRTRQIWSCGPASNDVLLLRMVHSARDSNYGLARAKIVGELSIITVVLRKPLMLQIAQVKDEIKKQPDQSMRAKQVRQPSPFLYACYI